MKLKALLASTLAFGLLVGPAAANAIGGVDVSDADWTYVAAYCSDLDGLSVSDAYDTEPSSVAELMTQSINLSSLRQSDCAAAGLI